MGASGKQVRVQILGRIVGSTGRVICGRAAAIAASRVTTTKVFMLMMLMGMVIVRVKCKSEV